jgi:hypothetical protein
MKVIKKCSRYFCFAMIMIFLVTPLVTFFIIEKRGVNLWMEIMNAIYSIV